MAISDKLIQINQAKQDIKNAIEDKGVDMSGVPFTEYANKVAEISSGGMTYEDYARTLFLAWGKSGIFPNAWQDMQEVDGAEIERNSTFSNQYGTLQYPNGEDNGVIIPDSVTSIGNQAFRGWSANNQPLVIPNSVTSIGNYGFYNWQSNNQPLVIPNSVTPIGDFAFYGWRANTHPLVIPNSVTSIGNSAFYDWRVVPYIEMQSETPPTITSNSFTFTSASIYVPDSAVDDYKTATNWVDLADRIFAISEKP